jgi:hypothetical protein
VKPDTSTEFIADGSWMELRVIAYAASLAATGEPLLRNLSRAGCL